MNEGGHHTAVLPSCPACDGRTFKRFPINENRLLWRCTGCHLEKIHPLPDLEELRNYYEKAYASGMFKPFVEASELKAYTAKYHFQRIRTFCRPGRWLDVGTSSGHFVKYAEDQGMQAEGLELTHAGTRVAQQAGLRVHQTTVEGFDPGYQFDTITAFDILEHVADPLRFLQAIRRLLVPQGTFVLALPNQDSLLRKAMGRHWFYYIPEEYLFYFNPKNIRKLVSRAGLHMSTWSREAKPLNLKYSMIWSQERSPAVHRFLVTLTSLSGRLSDISIPLFVGDMMVYGRNGESP